MNSFFYLTALCKTVVRSILDTHTKRPKTKRPETKRPKTKRPETKRPTVTRDKTNQVHKECFK